MLDFLLYLVAFVCLILAALWSATPNGRVNLIALGLAAWVLVPLHHAWPG